MGPFSFDIYGVPYNPDGTPAYPPPDMAGMPSSQDTLAGIEASGQAPFLSRLPRGPEGEPFSRMSPNEMAGLTPEQYQQQQGEIRDPPPLPQDYMQPAAQGIADLVALQAGPAIQSGTEFARNPGIATGTNAALDTTLALSPLQSLAGLTKRIIGITGAGTGAALAKETLDATEAEAANKKKKKPKPAPAAQPQTSTQPEAVSQSSAQPQGASSDPRIVEIDKQIAQLQELMLDRSIVVSSRKAFSRQVEDLRRQRGEVLQETTAAHQTFAQSHPILNNMWPAIQMGAGATAGALTHGATTWLGKASKSRWRQAVENGEKAFDEGDIGKATRLAREAEEYALSAEKPVSKLRQGIKDAAPAIAGGAVGAELSNITQNYDQRATLPGTPERKAADEAMSSDQVMRRMIMGGVLGAAGGHTVQSFMPFGPTSYPLERSKAFVGSMKESKGPFRDMSATDAIDEAQLAATHGAKATNITKGYLPSEGEGPFQNVIPDHAAEKVAKKMMSDPTRPKGAASFNSSHGRYVDAKGKFLPFED